MKLASGTLGVIIPKLYTFYLKSLKNDPFFQSYKQENLFYIKDLNNYYPIYTQPTLT